MDINVIGHQKQRQFLKQLKSHNRLPQAIIFSGPEALGKKMVALEFAKSLACSREVKNHQACPACSAIDKGQHPDVIMVEPEGKEIKIDQIRKIQHDASLSPYLLNIKIFIIDQAEGINIQAQNCFLKTLEEPKGQVIFILLATNPDQLIPTIRSRCFHLKFYPLPQHQMLPWLDTTLNENERQQILNMAQGCPGRLLKLQQPEHYQAALQTIKSCERLLAGDLIIRFKLARQLFIGAEGPKVLTDFLSQFSFFLKNQLEESLYNDIPSIANSQSNVSLLKIKKALGQTEELRMLLDRTNLNPRLAFENLLISF